MFKNLKAELTRIGYSNKELALYLGVHINTLRNKLSAKTDFSMEEIGKILLLFNNEFTFQELFLD